VDSLLVAAGSSAATLGVPNSPGVTPGMAADTLVLRYNDAAALEEAFARQGPQIAGVIVEPVVGNMGCVPPRTGYLEFLREITFRNHTILIFDEVMTGFRLAFGGAQQLYGIKPDMTTLGKIIGGGLPVGAYGGRAEIMDMIAPVGPVYQAGTLSGNPLAMAAGLAALRHLKANPEIYPQLEERTTKLVSKVLEAAKEKGVPMTANQVGSMFTWFFQAGEVHDWETAARSDTEAFGRFHRAMLERGIYLPPSQYEAIFMSAAHSEKDIEKTVSAAKESL
jgi:glutamate-1-semialdehyde 2,1-aminomutase